jgi:hypothetical protein
MGLSSAVKWDGIIKKDRKIVNRGNLFSSAIEIESKLLRNFITLQLLEKEIVNRKGHRSGMLEKL